jgi:peptidoglycan/LPS O-acetylase OafA/YrhL
MPRIPSLDGLRGVAILMVLIGHVAHSLPSQFAPLLRFAGNGKLGVKIFFVLSGFLIYSLSIREVEKTGVFNWRQFYLRRVLRIFPCFYLYLAVVLYMVAVGMISLSWQMIVSAATFSLNYRPIWDHSVGTHDYDAIGHYWTLALEEQFYLTWPLLMVLFMKRKLLHLLVFVMILAPFIRVVSYFLMPAFRGEIGMMFHTGFDSIAAGVLLGELLKRELFRKYLERLASGRWVVLGVVFFLVFISPILSDNFRGGYDIIFGASLDLIALSILITAAVSFSGSSLFRLLNWRPLVYVGVLSYSLYVWNNLFLLGGGRWYNVFPYNFAALAVMALLSHYLVEKPFLRLKRHIQMSGFSKGTYVAEHAG